MWGDRPMPFKESAAERKPDRVQPELKRCTNYGWPVGPTFKR